MKSLFACLVALAGIPAIAAARPVPETAPPRLEEFRLVGAPVAAAAKAASDTLVLLGPHGSGAQAIGTFENAAGAPDWNGWTSIDDTTEPDPLWHVSTFQAVDGAYSAWCGDPTIPSCGQPWDEPGGYPNKAEVYLEWRAAVADPTQPCTVTVDAVANIDTEPGYDYVRISCEKRDQPFVDLWWGDGRADSLAIGGTTVYAPGDYLGPTADEVRVVFRFNSDGAFSAEDCLWPNDGAMQLDNVVIALDNGTGYAHDFEDGTLGAFAAVVRQGVGDFAGLWSGLGDLDPCVDNLTPQVAFIDDGIVVPGTGGSSCITWCYTSGGHVVNSTGGIAETGYPYFVYDADVRLNNAVVSPPLAWTDPAHDGATLAFDVYCHEELIDGASAGIFYTWSVRSVDTGDPADLERASWRDDRFVYFGGPQYRRQRQVLDELLRPGCTHVQVRLAAVQWGWYWGWAGDDATPAPYFDNVRVETYRRSGPALSADPVWLAADAFPDNGTVDLVDLGANSVPFETSYPADQQHGFLPDSVTITCVPIGAGAALTGPPRFHYLVRRNPLFDPWRTAGVPDQGTLDCASNDSDPGRWHIDLPNEGFLFPGDRVHYYFTASQSVAGRTETAILPADTTGFSSFGDYPAFEGGYDPTFTVRALPTIRESTTVPGTYETNEILFWHDSGSGADWVVWTRALHEAGLLATGAVDVFHTQAASVRAPNGLGGRASTAQLAAYQTVVVTSGEMPVGTIDGGANVSPDAVRLDAWLRLGGRNLLAFGNDLASDLAAGSPEQAAFVTDWLGCLVGGRDVRPLIGNQTSPLAVTQAGNPVLSSVSSWVAYGGGCTSSAVEDGYSNLVRDRFDALTAAAGAVRLGAWAAPGSGTYSQAAVLLHEVPTYAARVVLVPVDFPLIRNDPQEAGGAPLSPAARGRLLIDVLDYFGHGTPGAVTTVPDAEIFTVAQHPNPFNPATTIAYTAPRPGRLTVKVYDVRGRLVRTLWDAPVAADGVVIWDGTCADGAAAPSGVYFYEARLDDDVHVGKMALVK